YAIESRLFDVKIMVVFGLIGFLMKEMRYPIAPLVLGMILGDLLDKNLRRALVVSDGNILEAFSRPISATILGFTLLMIVSRTQWFQTRWAHLNRMVFSRTAVTDRKGQLSPPSACLMRFSSSYSGRFR